MIRFLDKLFNLHRGEDDKEKTLQNVKNNISFSGANLWILACAILVASVGLNVNSTAVIIGAMLISPLMGPIVASGFALAIYDFDLLKKSLKNLLIATIVSLTVSTLYFFISPFKEVQSELLARTSPNIYDILIAFFGGLVGVIAVTRVEKGNPIPGVAIATALMPPLCTAGYGLATGHFAFFFGAFFLYCINCVFICIATFVIAKFLKYPFKEQVDLRQQRTIRYAITSIVTLMLVPSIYFAFRLYKQQQYNQSVIHFINKELIENGQTLVYRKINYNSNPKTVELAFLSHRFSMDEMKNLNEKLRFYNLQNTKIIIKQDSSDNIQLLKNNILNEIKGNGILFAEKQTKTQLLEEAPRITNIENKKLFQEARILFPELTTISIAKHYYYTPKDSMIAVPVLIYESKKKLGKIEKSKLEKWTKSRLKLDSIIILKN